MHAQTECAMPRGSFVGAAVAPLGPSQHNIVSLPPLPPMGCEASSPESPVHAASAGAGSSSAKSKQGSTFGQGSGVGSPSRSAAQKQRVESLTNFAKEWITLRGGEQKNDDVTVQTIVADCSQYFNAWPRGDKAGMLLSTPVSSGATLAERGIKLSWLTEAWNRMKASGGKGHIPTRAFVDHFIRPLLLEYVGDHVLFDFIPTEFRAKPFCYLSHAWDGWLKQAFFLPEHVLRDWPEDPAVWMDIFALNQVEAVPRGIMINEIKEVIQQIANTLLVLPGDGAASFSILPALRSWCIYEILCTPPNCISYRMSLHGDLGDAEFVRLSACSCFERALFDTDPTFPEMQHERVMAAILKISCKSAKSSFAQDKIAIDEAVESELGGHEAADAKIQACVKAAFASQYATVTSPPKLALENRSTSLGDYYKANAPDATLDA